MLLHLAITTGQQTHCSVLIVSCYKLQKYYENISLHFSEQQAVARKTLMFRQRDTSLAND